MPVPEAATAHYATQQALTASLVARSRESWAQLDRNDLDASWRDGRVGERLFVTLSYGQQLAASGADGYLTRVLDEQGIDAPAEGTVNARAFAGVASDGRDLETLLYEPVIRTKVAIKAGQVERAMAIGEASLMRIVATQMQDAGRGAVGVGIASRPKVTTWTRMLNPPACSRCAVLAGRVYRWSQGFLRHPMCQCKHIPSTEALAGDVTTDPRSYFDSLSAEDQARYFTKAGAQAIREGADIGQVVNVRRNMDIAGNRGPRSQRFATQQGRITPEGIYAQAGDDRGEAIRLLTENGYLRR